MHIQYSERLEIRKSSTEFSGGGKFSFFFFFVFCHFSDSSVAYGGSQARRLIRAVATGLCHSHSNTRSELSLQPTPQLIAIPDP